MYFHFSVHSFSMLVKYLILLHVSFVKVYFGVWLLWDALLQHGIRVVLLQPPSKLRFFSRWKLRLLYYLYCVMFYVEVVVKSSFCWFNIPIWMALVLEISDKYWSEEAQIHLENVWLHVIEVNFFLSCLEWANPFVRRCSHIFVAIGGILIP